MFYGKNEILIKFHKKYKLRLNNLIFGYYSFDLRERILLKKLLEGLFNK
ncbi:hypothetical protein [Marinitoga lauensis]|nr:hypothetical protein [Marinitoga lauensis]